MCGRYAVVTSIDDIADEFGAIIDSSILDLGPSFNIAPTDRIPIVLERTDQPVEIRREVHAARWGLVPSWAKDMTGAAKMINARLETATTKPAYRTAFARRRCVIPASGYYEWQRGAGRSRQPFYIHPAQGLLAMAGVFEWWLDEHLPADHSNRWTLTASILTTTPADHLAAIHNRMPAMLTPEAVPDWLDRSADDTHALADILRTTTANIAESLTPRPVAAEVGNVRNNHAGLIATVDHDS